MSGQRGITGGIVGAVAGFAIAGPVGAVALGAAGFQAGANLDAADKQVGAARRNQDLVNNQANEILKRASENTKSIMADAEVFKGEQVNSFVQGGVDVSSQSSLLALENAHAQSKRKAYLEERDASLTAQRLRDQAQNDVDAAKAGKTAAQIGAITSVLGTGATIYANRVSNTGKTGAAGKSGGGGYGSAGGSYSSASATA